MESEKRHIFTIDGDGKAAEKDFAEKLSLYIGRSNLGRGDEIKHVNIYWPIPMLQDHVTLVDTPGVGESPEMTEKLVKYLPNAVSFIYIINSANAGGIQEDTILHILSEQKKLVTNLELSSFDPTSMIFICNKWDIAERRGNSDATWLDSVQKLQMTIPGLDMDHIFRLSVTEATRYRRSGIGNTAMYQRLLEGLEHFIPDSLNAKVKRHYIWITTLLSKLEVSVVSRINNAMRSSDEKEKFLAEVMARILKLETDSEKVRDQLKEAALEECRFITQELHRHLLSEDIKAYLETWTEDEAPDIMKGDLDVTKFQAQDMIMKRLLKVIQGWENETHIVEKAAQTLTGLFNKECYFLSQGCKDVDDVMKEMSFISDATTTDEQSLETTYDSTLEASTIAIIAVTAPIWLPLGIVAFAILVPVGLVCKVKCRIEDAMEKKKYRKDKAKYMRKWALMVLDSLQIVDNVYSLIETMYLKSMLHRIDYLCSECIPKQIATDRAHLDTIINDKRTADEIIPLFRPKKEKLKELFQTMYLFDLKYLANDVIEISNILRYGQIGSGDFSDVYRATWRMVNGTEQEVALKILKGRDMYLQLSEVHCLRRLKHQNIIEFYGVVFANRGRNRGGSGRTRSQDVGLPVHDDRLMLVLDLCEQSLESLVFRTTELQCGSFSHDQLRGETHTFFFKMSVSICEGLAYMHRMKFLQRNLKLSNVLVKDGVGKLSDFGFARAEVAITGTVAGTLTHMAPELLNDKLYSFSSDVYSLGILLWELWYGKRSYSDTQLGHLGVRQFIDAVTGGARPNCELKHTMFPDLKKLVEKCWDNNPNYRPTVEEVATELKKIDGENRRVISR